MASALPPSSPDAELSPPVLVSMISEEEDVNQGFESDRWFSLGSAVLSRGQSLARASISELCFNCFAMAIVVCFFASVFLIGGLYGPQNVWLGPNSSILVESNSIFVKGLQVRELDYSKSGLQLFWFYRSPPLDVFVNWSESRLLSISHDSYKGWPYYLNQGTSLNISYSVKPKGSAVQLVVNEGTKGISRSSLNDNAFRDTAWSWNQIQGSGMIEFEISKSSSYYVAVVNLKRENVEVELDIDVRAVFYDTKQSFYNCTFSNGMCTFNAMSLVGNSVVVTSPPPSQGVSIEDEWYIIMLSYQPRWSAYVIGTGMVLCFTLVALQIWNRLQQCCGGETENDSARTRLLANKDDDSSSMGSCIESFASDDNDSEEFIGNDGEASNSSRRLCVICKDSPRDCFFLPCGHCVSCYQCGTKLAEGGGSCPFCGRTMKKVKRIYRV